MAKVSLILIFTMIFSTFMYQGWYKPKLTEAAPTADGRIFHSINSTTPQHRSYSASANSFGAQTPTILGVLPTWMVLKASPIRNEMIAGYVDSLGALRIYKWDGASWREETNTATASGGWGAPARPACGPNGVDGRRFDIAYENVTGNAIVVYSRNAATTNELGYRIWNGTSWSATEQTLDPARLTYAVSWVKLVSKPGANEITLGAEDIGSAVANTSSLTVMTWNGTAWGSEPTAAVSVNLQNVITTPQVQIEGFDIAYESLTGDRLIAYTQPGGTAGIYYRTYIGNALGTATSIAAYTSPAIPILRSDPYSDQVLVLYSQSAATNIYGRIWSGTALGAATTLNTGAAPATTATWAIRKRQFNGAWLRSGSTSYPVAFWQSSTVTTMNYRVCTSTTTPTWAAAGAYTIAAAAAWIDIDVDPAGTDTLMLTLANSSSDLYAKRAVIDGAGALTITNADGGAAITATLTTTNGILTQNFDFAYKQNPVFSFSVSNYSQAEGNSGSATVTITVNRTGNTSGTNAVTYATSDGSAKTADSDYVAATNTLTFTAGQTSQTFLVTINGDTKDEYDETVNLALSSPTNGAELGAQSTATITITNDDAATATVSFNSSTSTGSELNGNTVIPVSLSAASGKSVSVTYNTANGTAVAPGDFTAVVNGAVNFFPGETTKYLTLTLINDSPTTDPNETFTVTLSAPVNATLGATTVNTVTITEKWASTSAYCGSCHAYPPLDGTRSGATGAVVGSHQTHPPVCSKCHVTPATMTSADFGHRNANIELKAGATGIDGGYYNQDGIADYAAADATFAQRNNPTTQTCITVACHGGVTTPQWGVGTMDCLGCHNIAIGSRRAMATEFTTFTWSHKKTTGAWTSNDCGVCHMEGNPLTGATTAYHNNSVLEFRDPDTGVTIKGVTFSGTPGSYTSTGTDATATTFARNTGSNTLEAFAQAVQVNLCLKCHDGGANAGAASTLAQVDGSAASPFQGAGTVLNIAADFTTSYASYHPVSGRQNNSYADANTMVTPWNTAGSPGGTKTTKTALTNWGWLITCWDCHDSSAASRTIGGATASSTAHGGAVTLRATYNAVAGSPTNLCVVCHKQTVYWGSGTTTYTHVPNLDVSGMDADAATPNEWTNGGYHDADGEGFQGCTVCHGTTVFSSGALPARPRTANVHGCDTIASGGATWTSGARPWSFIRATNFGNWDNSPASCTAASTCGRSDAMPYVPGGVY